MLLFFALFIFVRYKNNCFWKKKLKTTKVCWGHFVYYLSAFLLNFNYISQKSTRALHQTRRTRSTYLPGPAQTGV